MITEQRKSELTARGWEIENMQEAWGDGWWNGQFRFVDLQCEHIGEPQPTAEKAWADLDQYSRQLDALAAA
jgi:hypothetical protein